MREVIAVTIFFFLLLLFSLYLGLLTREAISKGEIEPVFQNPYDYKNSLYMFGLILAGTVVALFFVKIKLELIKLVENTALLLLIATTFSYFLPLFPSFLLSFSLVLFSELRPSFFIKNLCIFLSVPSASAIIGASLDYKVVLLFFFILTIYDTVSVFLTRHMVYLAEKLASRPTALISIFPSTKIRRVSFIKGKKKLGVIALGAGDYFIPSSFCVSLLQLGVKYSLLSLALNTLTIFLLFHHISKREISRPLPALPFLFLSSLVSFSLSFYL